MKGNKKMKYYEVQFSYNIKVQAENQDDAERKAATLWIEITPVLDEMNISIKELKDT